MFTMNRMFRILLYVVSTFGVFGQSIAAEVDLDNGDRLTGTVVHLDENALRLQTDYAGEIRIDWQRVRKLTTDKEIVVLTKDNRILRGKMTATPGTGYELVTATGETIRAEEATIESINPADWEIGRGSDWAGKVNISLKSDRGNSEKDEIDLDVFAQRRRRDDRLEFRGDLEYDTSLGDTTKDKWNGLGKYDYFVTKKKYYAANAAIEHDEFKGLKLRYRLGPAIGYQFFEEKRRNLRAEVGAYYTSSDIKGKGVSEGIAAGWLVDGDYTFSTVPVQGYHWQSMVLSNPENMNFQSKTGLRLPLGSGFLASAEVEANWDAETASASDKTEVIYRFKLGYGW
jgi:putative salt-induced outer membrane protein YdiY